MRWLQRLIHRLVGPDRHHDLSNKVASRGLRIELLNRQLEVIERRKQPR